MLSFTDVFSGEGELAEAAHGQQLRRQRISKDLPVPTALLGRSSGCATPVFPDPLYSEGGERRSKCPGPGNHPWVIQISQNVLYGPRAVISLVCLASLCAGTWEAVDRGLCAGGT